MISDLLALSQTFLRLKNAPYRRYVMQRHPFEHRLSLLLGQRGIGKTTVLVQYLLDTVDQDMYSEKILYVQADHFLVGDTSLYDIAQEFHALGGKTLAFDEIHQYPNWSQELKSIYDTFPQLQIIASGSSALQLHRGSHDLSRRAIVYRMYGLSFREFLELSLGIHLEAYTLGELLSDHVQIADSVVRKLEHVEQKVTALFAKYLHSGYYPYFFELPNEALYLVTLEQNVQSTIEVDLAAMYPHLTRSSTNKLKELLGFIAKAVPFTPNWNTLKDMLEIGDARTVKAYFSYLEAASLIRALQKKQTKLDQLSKPDKIYLDNPNLMKALTFEKHNAGTMREIFFLDMLALDHVVTLPAQGDFCIDNTYVFEVGGPKKSFKQVAPHEDDGFIACDNIEIGRGAKIPLWVFGFLY